MIALDTNVLARLLLDDERGQRKRAQTLLGRQAERYWIPVTVCLELAWVLDSQGWTHAQIASGLRELFTLRNVMLQHPEAVDQALHWFADGLDFADALHLALSQQARSFATFDTRMHKRAVALGISPPITPV